VSVVGAGIGAVGAVGSGIGSGIEAGLEYVTGTAEVGGKEATDNHSGKREETRKAQQRQLQQKEKKEPSNLARDAVSKPGSDLDSKDTQNIHIASSDSVAAVKAKIASLRSEYEKLELQNAILLELLESKQAAEEAVGLDIITKQRQVNMLGRELGVDDGSALMREEEAGRREELSPAKARNKSTLFGRESEEVKEAVYEDVRNLGSTGLFQEESGKWADLMARLQVLVRRVAHECCKRALWSRSVKLSERVSARAGA